MGRDRSIARWSRRGLQAAAVLALAACATPRTPPTPYVPPTTGPTAKLVMRGAVPQGDLYGVYVLKDSERCAGSTLVGYGGFGRNPTSTTLAANQVTTLQFLLLKPNKAVCVVRWSFTPMEGRSYLLNARALQSQQCAALIMDMSDPEKLKPEPTALRRNPGNVPCLPLAQSKPLPLHDPQQAGGEAVLRQSDNTDDLKGLMPQ